MRIIACPECNLLIRVIGRPDEVESLVGDPHYPCPECDRQLVNLPEHEVDATILELYSPVDLSPQDAFLAFNGMGLPKERAYSRLDVEELFKTPVRRAVGQETGTGRYVLEHLEFWDGTKMYFGSAPDGAIVYRIARPRSYVKEALGE